MDGRRMQGLAMAAASGVLYGSVNVLAKPVPLHPFAKSAVMYLAAALVLLPLARRTKWERRDRPRILTMGLVGGGLAPVLLFFGLERTAASDAALILTLEMVATATLAALFLRERFHARELAGLAALLAAALLVAAGSSTTGSTDVAGALLILAAAVAWGVDNTVSAHLTRRYRTASLLAAKSLLGGGAALLLAVAFAAPFGIGWPAWQDLAVLAVLGVAAIALSSAFFYGALQRVGASRTSAMNIALTALVGAAGGAWLLGERLSWFHAAALASVLAGSALLAVPRRTPSSEAPL